MKILSTDINDLSHNKRNIQAANRMNIQAMLRSLDIEQRGEILYIEGSLNHAGHINEFELEISSHGEIFSHTALVLFIVPMMPAAISLRCAVIWHNGSISCHIISAERRMTAVRCARRR